MERFKINSMSNISAPLYRHSRRKSEQICNKESYININPQPSTTRLHNPSISFYRAPSLIKNPSTRNNSIDMKSKISLDLSKIRKNAGNLNFSARNSVLLV